MTATATQPQALTQAEIAAKLAQVRQASDPGKVEDGTRVHIHYKAFGTPSEVAKQEATRASELGLPRDRYTGRVSRVWKAADGSQCLNLFVELERDHKYRTLNVDKGEVFSIVVLGD